MAWLVSIHWSNGLLLQLLLCRYACLTFFSNNCVIRCWLLGSRAHMWRQPRSGHAVCGAVCLLVIMCVVLPDQMLALADSCCSQHCAAAVVSSSECHGSGHCVGADATLLCECGAVGRFLNMGGLSPALARWPHAACCCVPVTLATEEVCWAACNTNAYTHPHACTHTHLHLCHTPTACMAL